MLLLVPIHLRADAPHVVELATRLGSALGRPVRVRLPSFDPELAFDASRSQYNSTVLLSHLAAEKAEDGERVLGVAAVDLFIPVLTYVFGEAQLGGRAAVVSRYRLDNTLYGLAPDETLYLARLEKEAMHELGHTFGLLHCDDLDCVMHRSTYVEEIDLKTARFCAACRAELRLGGAGLDAAGPGASE